MPVVDNEMILDSGHVKVELQDFLTDEMGGVRGEEGQGWLQDFGLR